jgi:hypothetical protein
MTARRSRVPDIPNMDRAEQAFLDSIDRRQLALSEIEDLPSDATTADLITKINEILKSHRTR